jgi:hypothetical protein
MMEQLVELHFLGKVTESGNSPTLYGTDAIMFGKEVFVVQGWKVTDPEALAQLSLPDHEAVVAVPKELMRFVPEEDRGAAD